MDLRKKLTDLKERLLTIQMEETIPNGKDIDLDEKVNNFLKWYYENIIKGNYTNIGELSKVSEMRNFIEKVAVWYELRYPDYEINRLMSGSNQENISVDNIMFNENQYINYLCTQNDNVRTLEWSEFYNPKTFIHSLPYQERALLAKPKYQSIVYLDMYNNVAHLHLTSKGIIAESEGVGIYTNFKVKDNELRGIHIEDAIKLLKERGIYLPNNNELEKAITNVSKEQYQKEEMLNCVMYRIIQRGGNRIGPRRAFLFAKEFKRNIDIPMIYAIDYSDPGLRKFINEYLKSGGKKDLICYIGYFDRTSKIDELNTTTIEELLKTVNNDCCSKYTEEETVLQEALVRILTSQLEKEELKKEEIKQLRLQRKLSKSKNKPLNNNMS